MAADRLASGAPRRHPSVPLWLPPPLAPPRAKEAGRKRLAGRGTGTLAQRTVNGCPDPIRVTAHLDIIASFELPSDRRVVTAREVGVQMANLASGGTERTLHVAGVAGTMPALVARAIALAGTKPVVCVTADLEAARRLTDDLHFVWGNRATDTAQGDVLLFAPPESSPYADVNPDRRGAMARLVTLFQLTHPLPWRFLVVPAAGLTRKVVPRRVVEQHSHLLVVEQEIDRDALIGRLAAAGYLRVPLVEDPGSFAVRGSVIDIWPASSEHPVRLELYGDLILSLRSFDSSLQRTVGELKELWLPPTREAILTTEAVERAREVVRALCDRVDLPSSRARALVEDVASGRAFFGAEGFLPAYYALETLFQYLPEDAVVLLEDPPALTRAVRDELERAATDAAEKGSAPHLPESELYVDEAVIVEALQRRAVLALHRAPVSGGAAVRDLTQFEFAPEDTPSLVARDQADLERAVALARGSRGKHGALDPLIDRLVAWRDPSSGTAICPARCAPDASTHRLSTRAGLPPSAWWWDRSHAAWSHQRSSSSSSPKRRSSDAVPIAPKGGQSAAPRHSSRTCAPSRSATTSSMSSTASAGTWAFCTKTSAPSPSIFSSWSTRGATSFTCPSTG